MSNWAILAIAYVASGLVLVGLWARIGWVLHRNRDRSDGTD